MKIKQDLNKLDKEGMFNIIKALPQQFEQAIDLAKDFIAFADAKSASHDVVILGMGGSAIAGDILKDIFQFSGFKTKVKIHVVREYELPNFVDDKTYVICSSYSGETEETLSAFEEALKRTKRIACISSGGTLIQLAQKHKLKHLEIPMGFQPRAALGYSLTAQFFAIMNSPLITKTEGKKIIQAYKQAVAKLIPMSEALSVPDDTNIAFNIAKIQLNSSPVIISSSKFGAVNLRWRGQIQENAKQVCNGVLLPEMNHNYINGFENPKAIVNKTSIINFISTLDNPRISLRFEANRELLKDKVDSITDIAHASEDYLSAILELIYLGDWVSFYLAIIRGVDPTPIPMIAKLKSIMNENKLAPSEEKPAEEEGR